MEDNVQNDDRRRARLCFAGISVFIIPIIIGALSFFYADIPEVMASNTITVLLTLSVATFGVLVVFYTLLQTDEKRNSEFLAICTLGVSILFFMGMVIGLIVMINEDHVMFLEVGLFFNISSILSCVFVIMYYLVIFRVWKSDKWEFK